jgi:hypothetical protein
VAEIESAKGLGRQTLSTRQSAQPLQHITYAGGFIEAQLDGIESERICIAGEEQNANRERGSLGAWHDLKLPLRAVAGNGHRDGT